MTLKEKSWQIANSLCANALSGGTVRWDIMITILSEALQAAEIEAEQQFLAFHNEQTNQAVALAAADARQQEREACAKQIESFRVGGPTPETITYIGEALAAVIRAGGTL